MITFGSMKPRVLIMILGLCSCAPTFARAPSAGDVALEGAFLTALAIDWSQSNKYVSSCREQNPVIGACGQRVPLNAYIPISGLLHAALALVLPRGVWRTAWLGVTLGLEADTVYSNRILDRALARH